MPDERQPQPPRLPYFKVRKIIDESQLPASDSPDAKWDAEWHRWAREQLPPEPPKPEPGQ